MIFIIFFIKDFFVNYKKKKILHILFTYPMDIQKYFYPSIDVFRKKNPFKSGFAQFKNALKKFHPHPVTTQLGEKKVR